MAEQVCPPLGLGSVDMNALHSAARQGHDLEKTLEKVKTLPTDKEAVPEETAPAPVSPAEATTRPLADEVEETPAERAPTRK